jgi:hypothetical protein
MGVGEGIFLHEALTGTQCAQPWPFGGSKRVVLTDFGGEVLIGILFLGPVFSNASMHAPSATLSL